MSLNATAFKTTHWDRNAAKFGLCVLYTELASERRLEAARSQPKLVLTRVNKGLLAVKISCFIKERSSVFIRPWYNLHSMPQIFTQLA